jgi:phosphoglycerate dehydrogenase-like enzyme
VKILVFHPRMAESIAAALTSAGFADVVAVSDVARIPDDADAYDVLVANRFPSKMLARMTRLRWLQLTGVGVDHVRSDPPSRDVVVTTAGSVPARAVAEQVWFALLAFARAGPTLWAQQQAHSWKLPDARRMFETRLAVLGTGRIGREVAARAVGFDVDVVGINSRGTSADGFDEVAPASRLPEVLATVDALAIAVPLVDAGSNRTPTRGLVSSSALAALPCHGVVVDVSRAGVVDVDALVAALREGRLRGACVDVFADEPLPSTHVLWDVPGLLVTPHCAYAFAEEPEHLAALVVANARRFAGGEAGALENVVDVAS